MYTKYLVYLLGTYWYGRIFVLYFINIVTSDIYLYTNINSIKLYALELKSEGTKILIIRIRMSCYDFIGFNSSQIFFISMAYIIGINPNIDFKIMSIKRKICFKIQ